jgi:hypothetical protein
MGSTIQRACCWVGLLFTWIGCSSWDTPASRADGEQVGAITSSLSYTRGVAPGHMHTCATTDVYSSSGGSSPVPIHAACWGKNDYGQLGLGDTANRGDGPNEMGGNLPKVELGTWLDPTDLASGRDFSCALLNNGKVKCWGNNTYGQLGLGDTAHRGDDPGEMGDSLPAVDLGADAVGIAAGWYHACAVLVGGSLKCWGRNTYGALGLGDTAHRGDGPGEMGDHLPTVSLGSGETVVSVTLGDLYSCALLASHKLKCWGKNYNGQLGQGDTIARGDGPGEMGDALPEVLLGSGFVVEQAAAGVNHTCAVSEAGTLKCWGLNTYGQLGLEDTQTRGDGPGEMGDSLPAVSLGTGLSAVRVTAGYGATCVQLTGGQMKCWGLGSYGTLGLGDTHIRGDGPGEMGDALPVTPTGSMLSPRVWLGGFHACATSSTGLGLKCWGHGLFGQIGLGDGLGRGNTPATTVDKLPFVQLL